MAISDLSSLDRVIINPATALLHYHTEGLEKDHILCHIDSWFYGMPDELFAEAVRNGEIERVGDIYRITKKGKEIVEANQYPEDENWPPPPPVWD